MILKALALGFSSGIFCLGYCYPVLAPIMLSREQGLFKKTAISLALFLLGRLTAYIIFGSLVGLLGRYVKGFPLISRFSSVRTAARFTAVLSGAWFIYLAVGKTALFAI